MIIRKNSLNLKRIVVIPIILILALFCEFLASNFKMIVSESDIKGNFTIDHIVLENIANEEKSQICIKNIDNYLKKIQFNYISSENMNLKVNYSFYDVYGQLETAETTLAILKDINKTTLNINKKIHEIRISNIKPEVLSVNKIIYQNNYTFSKYRFCFFLIVLVLILYIYFNRNNLYKKLHIVAFLSIMLIGSMFILSSPRIANQNYDEQVHVYRAFINTGIKGTDLSDAYLYVSESPGIELPQSLETNNEIIDLLNSEKMAKTHYFSKSQLIQAQEIPYIIMSFGVKLATLLDLPFTIVFCIGKFMNLLFYTCLVGLAIKKCNYGKKIVFVLSMIPTTIYAATHYSMDAIMMGGFLLGMVMFLEMYKDKKKQINEIDIALFVIPIVLASLAKAIYSPIMLLMLLLPSEKFKNRKQEIYFKISIILMFVMSMLGFVIPMIEGGMAGDSRGGDTSAIRQIMLILKHPIGFTNMFIGHIISTINDYFFSYRMYTNFAYIPIPSTIYTMMYLIVLLYVIFTSGNQFSFIKIKQRLIIFVGILAIICMIYGSMYITFTEVGKTFISGVQPRYFIPLLFPLAVVLVPRIKCEEHNYYQTMGICYITVFVLLMCLYVSVIAVYGV